MWGVCSATSIMMAGGAGGLAPLLYVWYPDIGPYMIITLGSIIWG